MYSKFESPFSTRYASDEMQYLFSADMKFRTWRKLWIALARAEQAEGLDITDEQIAELEAHAEDINYDVAEAREREVLARCNEPRLCLWGAVPQGEGDHPFGRDKLLCRG